MLKAAGCVILATGIAAVGFIRSAEMRRRTRFWLEMCHTFCVMRSGIECVKPEITELVKRFARENGTPAQRFYYDIYGGLFNGAAPQKALDDAVSHMCKALSLNSDGAATLREIGGIFSSQDIADATAQCENCTELFRAAYDSALCVEKSRAGLCKSLGIAGGIFAVILFF